MKEEDRCPFILQKQNRVRTNTLFYQFSTKIRLGKCRYLFIFKFHPFSWTLIKKCIPNSFRHSVLTWHSCFIFCFLQCFTCTQLVYAVYMYTQFLWTFFLENYGHAWMQPIIHATEQKQRFIKCPLAKPQKTWKDKRCWDFLLFWIFAPFPWITWSPPHLTSLVNLNEEGSIK